MNDLIKEIIHSNAGQIGLGILSFLSGKWIFEYLRSRNQLKKDELDLDEKKVEILTKQFIERSKVIDLLQEELDQLQQNMQTLMDENIKLQNEVYKLKSDFLKNKQELKECLDQLQKYRP